MKATIREIQFSSTSQVANFLDFMGCDPVGIKIMTPKAIFRTIYLERISSRAANLLKQTFLAKGGEVAVTRGTADLSVDTTPVLICATLKQYKMALQQLKLQPWGLPDIAELIENALQSIGCSTEREYKWNNHKLQIKPFRTIVMGILNITPDSFSDGGVFNNKEAALARVRKMIDDGVDIIDIGAESTRPYGSVSITAQEELERLMPVLEEVLANSSVPVSIDTYKASVADAALKMGAHIINDIWGLQGDQDMAAVAAKHRAPVIVMHNRQEVDSDIDIMSDIIAFFVRSLNIANKSGIDRENIILDPGFGFGKTIRQNLVILSRMKQLKLLGCPLIAGTSRKRFIGETLRLPVEDRIEGTGATICQAIIAGANIVRVHDVFEMKRIARMMDAIMSEGELNGQN